MKQLLYSLLSVFLLTGTSACRSDLDSDIDGNHRSKRIKKEQVVKNVRMAFGGDFISESEEPLLRADDGDTYTAINVWRTEKNKTDAEEEKYAFGLFKNKEEINIKMVTGFEYRFEAAIIIEKDDKIEKLNGAYTVPFSLHNLYKPDFGSGWKFQYNMDEFVYSSYDALNNFLNNTDRECFCELYSGSAYVNLGSEFNNDKGIFKYPRVKRFYGSLGTFDPEINADSPAEIAMSYKSFGLKIVVEDLPSGYITFADITDPNLASENSLAFPIGKTLAKLNEWEGLFSMNRLLTQSETFKLKFTWHKGGNESESFTSDVTISPKTKKVLKVKITGTPNYETMGNVTFNMESDELVIDELEVSHDFE